MESTHLCRTAGVVAAGVLTLFTVQSARAQTYTLRTLYSFQSGSDGAQPTGVIRYHAGNLYGTTSSGGNASCNSGGCGTVYKVNNAGKETVLHIFSGSDGMQPLGGVLRDANGNLYGTTFEGGADNLGTVFKVSDTGKETVLKNFTPGHSARYSTSPLIQDADGSFYGTGSYGGAHDGGAVFKVSKTGQETVLYSFCKQHQEGCPDGEIPNAGVIKDAEGNLYGTTQWGGSNGDGCDSQQGCGVVFKLSKSGEQTVLYSFTGGADGGVPYGGLTQDADGNLYGTAYEGGLKGCFGFGCGVVFKVSKTGEETVLYSFTGGADGGNPFVGLIRDAEGNLYGTTTYGGLKNCGQYTCGVVFELSKTGTETVLYTFTGGADGRWPQSPLVRDNKWNLYGTTFAGGDTCGCGTVFSLDKTGETVK